MRYCEEYEVEQFDHVELTVDGLFFEGQITKLHPRSQEVTVRYEDTFETTRQGNPRRRVTRCPVAKVEFVRRDG